MKQHITEENPYPTAGQLERSISQRLSTLYSNQLGHRPGKIDCHLMGNKLVVSLENVVTPIEKLLIETQSFSLVLKLRTLVDSIIKPKLEELVEEIFQVGVTTCLYDTEIDADYAGVIVVLSDTPKTRIAKSAVRRK